MRTILRQRPLRFIFIANTVSMLGSGINMAGVTWYILQTTGSEMALGTLVVLQTIPAILLLPFAGVIIDREDRRRLVMLLDLFRCAVILVVAVLVFRGQAQLWQIYLMATLVGAGFWMFWPTITALIQELTPDTEFVHANTFLLAAVQGGWLMAGAVVGFIYNHVGLGGVLLIDAVTYVVSFLCYFAVRRGRVVVRPEPSGPDSAPNVRGSGPATAPKLRGTLARFLHELREGLTFLHRRPHVVLLGTSWALFIGAMLTQGVITAPLSDRSLHAGAVGYGWLNGGWAIGAFTSAWYAPVVIRALASRRAVGLAMTLLAVCLFLLPYSRWLAVAVALYALMGTGRGIGGVAISSSMMEVVPRHFMGRVQNTFFFFGTCLQLALGFTVGAVAHRVGLTWAFAIVGFVYLVAAITAVWPVEVPAKARAQTESSPAD